MSRRVAALLMTISLQCVTAQYCQNTCNCYPTAPVKAPLLQAECREEPTGTWAKNIKTIKIRTSMQLLTMTTLQDAWNLKEADLRSCNITQIMPNALAKVANLTSLWLSHNLIDKVDVEAFSKLENLKHLYLDNNRLTTFTANIHSQLKYLVELSLQRNNLLDIPLLPSSLKYLDVSHNNITTFNTTLMENLLHLDACINPINDIISHTILKKMKTLCLSGNINNMPENFSTNFLNLENFTFISYPNISTLNIKKIDVNMPHHNIITFHIGNTNLNDLLFLRNMVKLETLKLHRVSLKDFGSIDLVLPNLRQVKTLDFEGSPALVKTIFKNFQSLLNLRNLETVSFKKSNVTHLPCELCQMQRFLKIDFQDNPMDCDCHIAEIEASLPKPLQDYILLPENTTCQSPQQVFGLPIYKYRGYTNCSGSEECRRKNYTCKTITNFETTTTSSFKYDDDDSIYYIILSVVIIVLGTAITGLIIVYIILKKERRIEPQSEIQSQSFQQLQQSASEDASLI